MIHVRHVILALLFCWGSASQAEVNYLRDIKPVLQKRCYSCHGALKQKAGLRLDTGELIRQGGKKGPILDVNRPESSRLVTRLTSTDPEERMPPEGDPLPSQQVAALQEWIRQGASSPTDEKPESDPREHWAFRKPVRSPLPVPKGKGRANHPIDAFITLELDQRNLQPLPEASREILLRRVYLDLIGLPPTGEELLAFLADQSDSAYDRTVDRLLASPRYGERWARHWMDVWRYADWFGRRHVPDVWNSAPQIYRWRDWIVNSLNADKGYDRMVKEMLAADEICPEDETATVATGFLVRNWYALNPNQWMRENVEHTAKAFLGLTLNCAHCHDHKYDPISQKEYFQFRAFFEPLGLRQDWWKGEPDPGPFQKYDYSVLRKVVKSGSVRVFDENLEARTHLYQGGDERNTVTNEPPVLPAAPAIVGGDSLAIEPIHLAPRTFYPGLKDFIRTAELEMRRTALQAARSNLLSADQELVQAHERFTQLAATNSLEARTRCFADTLVAESKQKAATARLASAQADLSSLESRLTADQARYGSLPIATVEAKGQEASRAERMFQAQLADEKLLAAQSALDLLKAEQTLADARRVAQGASEKTIREERDKETAALKKATEETARLAKAAEVARGSLGTNSLAYTPLGPVYPEKSSGRRRALAEWMVHRDNPLAARVAVNHIWLRHFRTPLVRTVFDFGRNGARPTHPALLDWLAVELMESGWSMKHLHRLIVTSDAYRRASGVKSLQPSTLASEPPAEFAAPGNASTLEQRNASADPENVYLWRMNPGQMEAEVVRDSLLHLAGELDPTFGGYPIANTEAEKSKRRTLYLECFPEEGGHNEFSKMFDPPDPADCYRRSTTVVPQQALALSNSQLSRNQSAALARKLAERLGAGNGESNVPPVPFIQAAYEQILTRPPSAEEIRACTEFLLKQAQLPAVVATKPDSAAEHSEITPLARSRASLVHALFSHHDFITVR